MKGYKGFAPGLVCRGKQYAEHTVFEEENAEICRNGMHFCKEPFAVLDYYGFVENGEINDFAEVEALAKAKTDDGEKYCTTKLKIGAKIGIPGLVKAQIEYVKQHTTMEHTDPSAATAGDSGAATAGDSGAATAGDSGAATAGKNGIAVCNGGKVRGGLGAVHVVAERDDYGKYVNAAVAHVDGESIKADTWYKLVNGEFVEAE